MVKPGQTIQLSDSGHVAVLTLNRPAVRNAMDRIMVQEIAAAIREIEGRQEIHAVMVIGSAPSFCSGTDTRQPFSHDLQELYCTGFAEREAPSLCRKPMIAAVSGAAFGAGCELALMCDIIVADTTASFSLPEVTRKTMPGFGGTQRLARLVGRIMAMEMCLTGRRVAAEEALRIGLVNRVVEPQELASQALALATVIADAPPAVSMMIKEAISGADEGSLQSGLRLERRLSQMSLALRGKSVTGAGEPQTGGSSQQQGKSSSRDDDPA